MANKERGDDVEIALAGDAVVLIKDAVINSVVPVGWPPLKDTFPKVVQHGVPIHVRGPLYRPWGDRAGPGWEERALYHFRRLG